MSDKKLVIDNLSVVLGEGTSRSAVVKNISFTLVPGKVVALVGESGSGKSVTARTIVGLTGQGAEISADRLEYGGQDLRRFSENDWRTLRGKEVGFVLQDALVSLDPLRPVGAEIEEALWAHDWGTPQSRRQKAIELLISVGVQQPEERALQRPDQLSGGLRQRALIASAIALDPPFIIADEPTTALDSTIQAQIIELFRDVKARGTGLLIISHDLNVVRSLADEIVILNHGAVVERGSPEEVFGTPRHPYTRSLLAAVPGTHPRGTRLSGSGPVSDTRADWADEPVLDIIDIGKTYPVPKGGVRQAASNVNLTIRQGRTVGIVGESGSGKTTVARIALGLLAPDSGRIEFRGKLWAAADSKAVNEKGRRALRREIGVVYQDPLSSFDPRWNVARILGDALDAAGVEKRLHASRIIELLTKVRLSPEIARRWPLTLSGGQRQRIAIARALASNPRIIVCDEPVSALDVSVQAQVLDLLADLQNELGVAYLFISHDLGVIRHVSDEIVVMQDGEIVEKGNTEDVFNRPQHPFTRRLIEAAGSRQAIPAL